MRRGEEEWGEEVREGEEERGREEGGSWRREGEGEEEPGEGEEVRGEGEGEVRGELVVVRIVGARGADVLAGEGLVVGVVV